MHNGLVKKLFMGLAAFLLLIVSYFPHHHHNGYLCLSNDVCTETGEGDLDHHEDDSLCIESVNYVTSRFSLQLLQLAPMSFCLPFIADQSDNLQICLSAVVFLYDVEQVIFSRLKGYRGGISFRAPPIALA